MTAKFSNKVARGYKTAETKTRLDGKKNKHNVIGTLPQNNRRSTSTKPNTLEWY